MDAVIRHAGPLHASLTVPPDKAICHRAVLLAALAEDRTTIAPWPLAEDCQRTLELVHRLGVAIHASQDQVILDGRGPSGLSAPTRALDCGESGTTLRLAAGLLAGQPFRSTLSAGASLSQRPMRRIVEPLTRMGARIEGARRSGARPDAEELVPPLTIEGRRPLDAIRYEMPVASAQVKSAILLAALFAPSPTTVIERVASRDHTERMLRHFGISVHGEGLSVTVEPGIPVSPGTIRLPGDFSSAAFFLVAAACLPGSRLSVQDVSLNPSRIALLEVLRRMGAAVTAAPEGQAWEPRGTVTVEARPLRGIRLSASEAPGVIDELPILMVAAACAEGVTRLDGVGELRVKETDRLHAMLAGLGALGARIRLAAGDTVEIAGGVLGGAAVDSAGDHRTAMSLAVAGLIASGTTTVRGAECVAKSFPDFFDRLGDLAPSSTVKTVDKA